MAKVNVVLSASEAAALVKVLTTQVKGTKTVEKITSKVETAIAVSEDQAA
jgi:hypothetical protein